MVFTAHVAGEGSFLWTDQQGHYLSYGLLGGIALTEDPASDNCSLWQLVPAAKGYYMKSVGAETNLALGSSEDKINAFRLTGGDSFLVNFYEVP